jgi:hypothetical protein
VRKCARWEESEAFYFETYEKRFWEAEREGFALEFEAAPGRLEPAGKALHERRLALDTQHGWAKGDPMPRSYQFTFTAPAACSDCGADRALYFVNPFRCDPAAPEFGTLLIRGTGSP